MKLTKTNLNKLIKQTGGLILDIGTQYLFKGDTFSYKLNKADVDAITMQVAALAKPAPDPSKTMPTGETFALPDLKAYKNFVSKDQARPLLECVHFDENNIVATDSYMMILEKNYTNITGTYDYYALTLADEAQGIIDEQGNLHFENLVINRCKLGEYPNYKNLIPTGETYDLIKPLLPNKINNPYSHISNELLIHFKPYQSAIITTLGTYENTGREIIADIPQHSTIEATFNYKKFKDTLSVFDDKIIECLFIGALKPIVFKTTRYTTLLMPTRFDGMINQERKAA